MSAIIVLKKQNEETFIIKTNCVKMMFCNPRFINRKEETISHLCVTEDLDFSLLTKQGLKRMFTTVLMNYRKQDIGIGRSLEETR